MIGYRLLASTTTIDAEQKIIGILENWFRSKHFDDLPPADSRVENRKNQTIQHQQRSLEDGTKAFRWLFKEQWDKAPWQEDGLDQTATTRITITSKKETTWFLADVHPPMEQGRYGDRPRDTATPFFVQNILNAVDLYDGQTLLSSRPTLARTAEELDVVLNAIQDEERRGMVLVTTPPVGQPPELWQEKLHEILRGVQGLTSIHMVSTEKVGAFNAWTGDSHSLLPGSIRTYKTGVDFDNRLDGYVHRIMLKHRIFHENPKKLNRIIRRSLITELASAELPAPIRNADIAFRKVVRLYQTSSEAGQTAEVDDLHRENQELNQLLDASDQENNELRNRIEDIEKRLKELMLDNDLLSLEMSSTRDEVDRLNSDKRLLQRKLWNSGDETVYSDLTPPLEDIVPPQTFAELLERIEEMPGVLYCGDHEITKELDEFPDLGVSVVQKTWEILRTFDAYVQARSSKEFDGGIFRYQRNPEHGHYMRIRQISAHESDTVQQNPKMREQRTFAVPVEIDPSGKRIMYAHVPLATGRGRSPRLYFEDTWTTTKQVTVGYIGPHLDTKSTN